MWSTTFIVSLVTTLLFGYVQIVNAEDPPPQEKCPDLKALKSSDPNPAYQITEWVVGRVTFAKDPPPDPTVNTCSVFTFYDACKTGAIHYTTKLEPGSSGEKSVSDAYAYYTESNSLVHYYEKYTKEDKNYNVWKGNLERMETINDDQGNPTPVDPIPAPVLEAHGKEFALVAVDKDGHWIMHRVCGTDIVWVSFAREAIRRETDPKAYLAKFNGDIDARLKEMNLDPVNVKEIETVLKINPPDTQTSSSPSSPSPPPTEPSPPPPPPLCPPPPGPPPPGPPPPGPPPPGPPPPGPPPPGPPPPGPPPPMHP